MLPLNFTAANKLKSKNFEKRGKAIIYCETHKLSDLTEKTLIMSLCGILNFPLNK